MASQTGGPRSMLENLEDQALGVPRALEEDLGGGYVHIKTPIEVLREFLPEEYRQRLEQVEDFRNEFLESPMMTLDAPYNLSNWAQVLEHLGADAQVAGRLANLAASDPMAHAEATRILAHLLKPGGPGRSRGPGGWLTSVINEAEEYLRNWEEWESRAPWQGTSRERPHWRRSAREDPQQAAPRAPPSDPRQAPWAPPHMRPSGAAGPSGASGSGAAGSGGSSGSHQGPPPPASAWARYRNPGVESPWGPWNDQGSS